MVGKDTKVDVAVLRVKPDKPLKAVKFGDSDKLRVGDWVMAVGNPFGLGGTVTAGIVSARNRDIDTGPYDNYIQTDAAINKGNSGGPLFNMDGEVIGINTAILSPSGGSIGIGFAMPANTGVAVIDQLRQFGETRRGWLGVRIQNVDDDIAESLNLGPARGALVAGVDDNGPAKPAGIKAGDVIIKFDGQDIKEIARPAAHRRRHSGRQDGDGDDRSRRQGRDSQSPSAGFEDSETGRRAADKNNAAGADKIVVQKALGMEFSSLSDDERKQVQYQGQRQGRRRDRASIRTSRRRRTSISAPATSIVEVNQEPVIDMPADVTQEGRKSLEDAGRKIGAAAVWSEPAQGEDALRARLTARVTGRGQRAQSTNSSRR